MFGLSSIGIVFLNIGCVIAGLGVDQIGTWKAIELYSALMPVGTAALHSRLIFGNESAGDLRIADAFAGLMSGIESVRAIRKEQYLQVSCRTRRRPTWLRGLAARPHLLVAIGNVFANLLDMRFHCSTSRSCISSKNTAHDCAMRRNCDLKSLGRNCEVLDLAPSR